METNLRDLDKALLWFESDKATNIPMITDANSGRTLACPTDGPGPIL